MDKSSSDPSSSKNYEAISPTAWGVAFRRTLSDIPYSGEIFEEMQLSENGAGGLTMPEDLKLPALAPMFEARYKLVNKLLKKENVSQILEMASGFSPRGLEFAKNPNLNFIELDLSAVASKKQEILNSLIKKTVIPNFPNLKIESGSALNLVDILEALKDFDKSKQIAVVNEGLLRYLNFEEKTQVAKNIHQLLEIYGGVWITPDISIKDQFNNSHYPQEQNEKIKKLVGRNIDLNLFTDLQHAKTFFADLGFNIETHSFTEVEAELVSPKNIGQSQNYTRSLLDPFIVFVMRIKNENSD